MISCELMHMPVCLYADFGPACDERSPERSDADGGSRGRDSSGHDEEIRRLLSSVRLGPSP